MSREGEQAAPHIQTALFVCPTYHPNEENQRMKSTSEHEVRPVPLRLDV